MDTRTFEHISVFIQPYCDKHFLLGKKNHITQKSITTDSLQLNRDTRPMSVHWNLRWYIEGGGLYSVQSVIYAYRPSWAANEGGAISGFDFVCTYMKRRHADTNSDTVISNLFFSRFHHCTGFLSRSTGAVRICISLWRTDKSISNIMQQHSISQIRFSS